MEDAWWGPTVPLVGAPWFALSERNSPGSIIVNMSGKRFMNESMPYVEAVPPDVRRRVRPGRRSRREHPGLADLRPAVPRPLHLRRDCSRDNAFRRSGWSPASSSRPTRSTSWPRRPACPPTRSPATVERFNGFARSGVDEDFHRGESAYDRYYGDPTNKPNPNLGEINHGPFYAAKMVPGDLGTKGGIRTDVQRPRAARRRLGDRGPVRGRQRQLAGDGSHLPGPGRHHRSRDDVRLPGRRCRPSAGDIGTEGLTCRSISTRHSAPSCEPVEFSWTSSDVQLYHLGLGAGADPMDQRELRYLTDDTPQVLPTFGSVAPSFHMTEPPDGEVPRHRHRAVQGAARQRGGDRARRRSRRAGPAIARHPVHRHLGQGQGRGDLVSETTVTDPDGTAAVDARSARSSPAARAASAASAARRRRSSRPTARPTSRLAIPVSAAAGAALPAVR